MPIAYLWFSLAMLLCELILSWSMQVTVKIHIHLQGFLKAKQYGTLTFSYEDEPVYWRRIYTTIEASLRTKFFLTVRNTGISNQYPFCYAAHKSHLVRLHVHPKIFASCFGKKPCYFFDADSGEHNCHLV